MSSMAAVQNKEITLGLMGQPNTGKSTVFNALTGSRQHVGNWPGKTVERKDGVFTHNQQKYTLVDLPGTYSLSANSEEEIITREYIVSSDADMVFALVDSSQLERSMFLLADFAGIHCPIVVLLNMVDVAKGQGKTIDAKKLSKALGVPVLPIVASKKEGLEPLYAFLDDFVPDSGLLDTSGLEEEYMRGFGPVLSELTGLIPESIDSRYSAMWLAVKLLEGDREIAGQVEQMVDTETFRQIEHLLETQKEGMLISSDCKFRWIHTLVKQTVSSGNGYRPARSKFDRLATSKRWGKPIAIGVILGGLILSLLIGYPLMGLIGVLHGIVSPAIEAGLTAIGVHTLLISLICDAILVGVSFALLMTSFVFGSSLVFGFMEEVGYMARISYVFNNTMSRLGLQGKAIMPFLVSFGCTIGGMSGTRVIDSWGQRVLAMSLAWVVPCASTWGVVGLVSGAFFGGGAVLVVISLFAVAMLHMVITSKVFRKSLVPEGSQTGLIMELPPYHKPNYKTLFRFVFSRMSGVLKRAVVIIVCIATVFWALSYSADGDITHSVIYRIGTFIEPVTMWFGLRWQMFVAFVASGMGKEGSLGVLSALFNLSDSGIWSSISNPGAVDTAVLGGTMLAGISKAEALAFLYAFFFNIPCLSTVVATANENHSWKWTLRITLYYLCVALLMSTIAYHIGLLIF